jgi:hypothetical protein
VPSSRSQNVPKTANIDWPVFEGLRKRKTDAMAALISNVDGKFAWKDSHFPTVDRARILQFCDAHQVSLDTILVHCMHLAQEYGGLQGLGDVSKYSKGTCFGFEYQFIQWLGKATGWGPDAFDLDLVQGELHPDVVVKAGYTLRINGVHTPWIELKHFYGSTKPFYFLGGKKGMNRKAEKYTNKFGSGGMYVFACGYADHAKLQLCNHGVRVMIVHPSFSLSTLPPQYFC